MEVKPYIVFKATISRFYHRCLEYVTQSGHIVPLLQVIRPIVVEFLDLDIFVTPKACSYFIGNYSLCLSCGT